MKKDNLAFNEDIQMFLQGKKEQIEIYQEMLDGYMALTYYSVLPGIHIAFNDIHTTTVPVSGGLSFEHSLIVNFCLEGRCEFHLSEDNYSYIDKNHMSVSTRMVQDSFYYPSGFYQGWEIYALPDTFTDETRQTLKLFAINFEQLYNLYGKDVSCITSEPFLTRTQAALAKKAQEILLKDLSRHISAASIAASLGVSETSLKNYFRSVYGMNLSTYLNHKRMELAAKLLSESDQNISDIAKVCGYANQGRFAKVFKDFYHMKPLDYRRNEHLP